MRKIPEDLLTISNAAAKHDRHRQAVARAALDRGTIPVHRIDGIPFVRDLDVRNWAGNPTKNAGRPKSST